MSLRNPGTEPQEDQPHADLVGNSVPEWQEHGNNQWEKEEPWDSGRGQVEKAQLSLEPSTTKRQEGKAGSDSSRSLKEKMFSENLTSERKRKFSQVDTEMTGFSSTTENDEEEYETPSKSFEEYLTYDAPHKKKKKIMANPFVLPGEEEQCPTICLLCNTSLDGPIVSAQSPSRKRTNGERAEQEQPEAPQPKRILLDMDITLPDIPLPPIQASCRPLPTPESRSGSQIIRRAESLPAEESQVGCTGHRPNPKPPVLPEGTHQLWPNRWLRDFRSEEPEEFQSWREMYLYHQEAREREREQEQVTAAQTIASAPANNGQANNTVPLDTPPGAPQEGHQSQENLGTGGAPLPENTNINPVPYTPSQRPTSTSRRSPDVREEQSNNRPGATPLWSAMVPRAKFSWFPVLRKPAVKSFKKRTFRRLI